MDSLQAVRLLQFGDSAFPVGSFSFSSGLETAVQEGVVSDAASLAAFTRTSTRRAATSDGIALLHAHRAVADGFADRIVAIDRAVYARKLNEEVRTQSVRTGKKLAEVALNIAPSPLVKEWLRSINDGSTPGTFPVGLGVVFAELGHPEQHAFAVHQYGVAMAILGAALRLMRIDHMATQAILFEVSAEVDADLDDVSVAELHDMATFAPVTDLLAAAHVRSHVRMFMN
jgi:urease accessory protein